MRAAVIGTALVAAFVIGGRSFFCHHATLKFKPMIQACENLASNDTCTSWMTGHCRSDSDGMRSCSQHHHGPFHKFFHGLKPAIEAVTGKHWSGNDHHHGPKLLGDCGDKADGETCMVGRPGVCIPSGKCPIFNGEIVCKPNDSHPPSFITDPCKGKQPGDDCRRFIFSGKCWKGKYTSDVVCKMQWPSFFPSVGAEHGNKDEEVQKQADGKVREKKKAEKSSMVAPYAAADLGGANSRFQPMILACDGLAAMDNCTSSMTGRCGNSNGLRSCSYHHHHGFHDVKHADKALTGKHWSGHDHHHEHQHGPELLGDCGDKADGEACTVSLPGVCIPSGKCPIFKGKTVCKPNDSHPPSFLTDPCKGKQPGDDCKRFSFPGKCWKGKYTSDVVCRSEKPSLSVEKKVEKDENMVMVV